MSERTEILEIAGSEIAEFIGTELALADLSARYKDVVFAVATKDGMVAAIKGRAELRQHRVSLENARVKRKERALRFSQHNDAEARRITSHLEALEKPIDAQIKTEESRKELEKQARIDAERKRVAGIQKSIAAISSAPSSVAFAPSAGIATRLKALQEPLREAEFAELIGIAREAQGEAIEKLTALYAEKVAAEQAAEQLARDRDELDRQRVEHAAKVEAAEKSAAVERNRLAAEARAKQEAEADERRKVEDAERAERQRVENEARAMQQAEIAAERKRVADADDESRRKERAAELLRNAERIKTATLIDAAKDAASLIRELGEGDNIITVALDAAIRRHEAAQ